MCCDYNLPEGVFDIGQKVRLIKPYFGWFDYSIKREIPVGTEGIVFKIEKVFDNLDDLEYTIKFDSEFTYVRIKHGDLINV